MNKDLFRFPHNISTLVNRRKALTRNHSIDAETEVFDIDDKLYAIKLFYFSPNMDLDTPKKILEMAGLFAEHEASKVKIQEQLENTGFEKDFDKTDGGHLIDGDLKEILAIRRVANRFLRFREIIENPTITMKQKRQKLTSFANSHKEFFEENAKINKKHLEKIEEAGLSFGDYLLAESYYNWGLSSAIVLYIAGLRERQDFLNANIADLCKIKGFGGKSTDEFTEFVDTLKTIVNFDVNIWAFDDVNYSYKENLGIEFFDSIENTLLAYNSFL